MREVPLFVRTRTFLGFVGAVYFLAFTSFGMQSPGLIGANGILPFGEFLRAAGEQLGRTAYRLLPTVLWLNASDAALRAVWVTGALAALAAIFTLWQRWSLALCLVLWISLCSVGQDFLSFQWDILLSEVGFLALFAGPTRISVWLFRWLGFRLMFFSGVVKLASHDVSWRNLTALHFHYETQPLPTPLAWYFYQLPMAFQKVSTALTLAVELGAPFLYFAPRRWRHCGAWLTIALQVLIFLTGNYTWFNVLTIGLMAWMFIEPDGTRSRTWEYAAAGVVAVLSVLVCLESLGVPAPPGGREVARLAEPLHIVNAYGLFAVMTTERLEIEIEGSDDRVNWRVYEFRYKPGDLRRAPPIVEPEQPRLDWQMWFAALGTREQNRWFDNLMIRLLQGEPTVLRLLERNPFPRSPPQWVRARLFLYHFTKWGEAGWWTREERGEYFPASRLRQRVDSDNEHRESAR